LKGSSYATFCNFIVDVCRSSRDWSFAANPLPNDWPQTSAATCLVERLSDCRGRVYSRANDRDVRELKGDFMNSESSKPLQQAENNSAESNQMTTQPQPLDPATAKRNKRGFGLLMIAAGVFLLWMNWNSSRSSGTYWPMASVLAPTVIGIGCSILLFPDKKTHNALGFVGFLLGIVNWLFISGTL
jgi:hypothetical protein